MSQPVGSTIMSVAFISTSDYSMNHDLGKSEMQSRQLGLKCMISQAYL